MNILVPNLGSTSLKYQILSMPAGDSLAKGRFERVKDYREAIGQITTGDVSIDAVGFKAVHGGPDYRGTFRIDDAVIRAMEQFLPAAVAHNRIYLAAIRAFQENMPGVPLVAAFETEFHATMPDYAREYGVPRSWASQGVQKYGFHGASHQYISERVAEMLGRETRLVSCHLGGSSSVCAIERGRSVDTSMGFSPQSGLENATRHGDLDVFAVLYMMERYAWGIDQVRKQLAGEGGLAGLSGISGGDLRDVEQADTDTARLALDVFSFEVRKTIGAYAAAMGGLDAIAFTGGIGENSWRLRQSCLKGLEFLGIELDAAENESGRGDRLVSTAASKVKVLTLGTNEELIVARRTYRCLTAA